MQLLKSSPVPPPLPKQWSNQLPSTPVPLRVGAERNVIFASEAMGVKLNRGSDGIIRVVSVENGRSIVREGDIYSGDVIREAANVDLRRPLTKVMWSDTVAFLKTSSRPLTLVVAEELSDVPSSVVEELSRARKESSPSSMSKMRRGQPTRREAEEEKYEIGKEPYQYYGPSPASGIESVAETEAMIQDSVKHYDESVQEIVTDGEELLTIPTEQTASIKLNKLPTESINRIENIEQSDYPIESIDQIESIQNDGPGDVVKCNEEGNTSAQTCGNFENESQIIEERKLNVDDMDMRNDNTETPEKIMAMQCCENPAQDVCNIVGANIADDKNIDKGNEGKVEEISTFNPKSSEYKSLADNGSVVSCESKTSLSFEETSEVEQDAYAPSLRKDIIFLPQDGNAITSPIQGWTNESWLACKHKRKLSMCCEVSKKVKGRFLFWSRNDEPVVRTLAVFTDPDIILITRKPTNMAEVQSALTDIPPNIFDNMTTDSFAVAETVIDLKTCKMRLSPLTTPSSVCENSLEEHEKDSKHGSACDSDQTLSYFDFITPTETISLSAVVHASSENSHGKSNENSEIALQKTFRCELALKNALLNAHGPTSGNNIDASWQHQIILGSLHSHVISGNYGILERALAAVPSSIINGTDNSGFTALHHACIRRSSKAVTLLLAAGADASIPSLKSGKTPCHFCAEKVSLNCVLSVFYLANVLTFGGTNNSLTVKASP